MFRGYYVFTSVPYRWVIWLVYPLLAVLGCIAVQTGFFGLLPEFAYGPGLCAVILESALPMVETIQDFFIFGGIHRKAEGHFEYLKSSEDGKKVYVSALVLDHVRRALTIILVFLGNILFAVYTTDMVLEGEVLWEFAGYFCWTFCMSTIGVFAARFSRQLWLTIAIAYGLNLLAILGNYLFSNVEGHAYIFVLVALTVGVCRMSMWLAIKKLERSYYDS